MTEGWLPYAEKYFAHDTVRKQQATDLMAVVDRGLIGYAKFITEVAKLAGVSEVTAHAQIMRNVPNEPLFSYIKEDLAQKYKIGILSNAGANRLEELIGTEHLALIDAAVLSYDSGFVKPQAGAYESIAQKLGAPPDTCIFIDDQEKHCEGARTVGMQAICYQSFDQFKTDLEKILAK